MAKTYTIVCWLTVVVWLLGYIETVRGQGINLDGLQLSNYTTEVKLKPTHFLKGWYKMTNGFISLVHSKTDKTVDLMIEYMSGKKIEWPNSLYELLKLQYAMLSCVMVGLVFAVIMALTGIIFFICRMCGNCGGKRAQVITNRTATWRKVYIFSLLALAAVLLPAIIISFTINNSLKTSLNEAEKTVFSSLHDAEAFVNNTEKQVKSLVRQGLKEINGGVTREIKDVENTIRRTLLDHAKNIEVLQTAKLTLSRWISLPARMEDALEANQNIENMTLHIEECLRDLRNNLTSALDVCNDSNCNKIDALVFTLNKNAILDPGEIVEVVENLNSSLQGLDKEDYDNFIPDVLKALNLLPSEIAKKIGPILDELLLDLTKFQIEILNSEILKTFEKTANTTRNMVQKLHHTAKKGFPDAHKYDKYRWYVGLALFIIVAVVVGGLLIGLFCGICGHQNKKQATKRTTLSNAGGLTLMFTVYWVFLFSAMLMLFTTSIFALGGMTEAYICRPAFDHNFSTFDKLMDVFQRKIHASNETSLIEYLKPSDALRICANNGTIYTAFNLGSLNISSLFNYREKLKIKQRTKELQDNSYPGPVFYNDDYDKLFSTLIEALDINTSFVSKLREKLMDGYETQIELISEVSDDTMKELVDDINVTVLAVEKIEKERMTLSSEFQRVADLKIKVMEQKELFRQTELAMPGMIQSEIKQFVEKLTKDCDHMIEVIIENFEMKLAPCRPLWNIFDASRTVLCKHYVQPLNGIWFATGWALFFFIPTIIVSTLLSKHFLRMKSVYAEEKEERNGYELEGVNGYKTKLRKASYKL